MIPLPKERRLPKYMFITPKTSITTIISITPKTTRIRHVIRNLISSEIMCNQSNSCNNIFFTYKKLHYGLGHIGLSKTKKKYRALWCYNARSVTIADFAPLIL